MFRFLNVASVLVALGLVAGLAAPSIAQDLPKGADVINKSIKASGGDKYKDVKNRVTKSTLSIAAMGMEAQREEFLAPPNSLVSMSTDFGDFLNGTTADVAWSVNPMQGAAVLEGEQKEAALRQAQLNPFQGWDKGGATAETVGEETVGEEACYKVEVKRGEGDPETYLFSKDSGLLVQIQTVQDGMPANVNLSDYKEVDGIKIPHKTSMSGGQFDIEITVNSVEHNVDIPEEKFELPAEIKALTE